MIDSFYYITLYSDLIIIIVTRSKIQTFGKRQILLEPFEKINISDRKAPKIDRT